MSCVPDKLTLILRDVEERLSAEQRIVALTGEARYLSEELKALQNVERIVGSSPALLGALRPLDDVMATDTTVLLLGETGTGKELFARAVHAGSNRRDKRLVKLNCAAIPHNFQYTCVVVADTTVQCWGENAIGTLGSRSPNRDAEGFAGSRIAA